MGKLRFASICCGRISKNHITAIATNAEVMELVAVCDPIEACAKKRADSYLEQSEKRLRFIPIIKRRWTSWTSIAAPLPRKAATMRDLPWTAFEKASTF